MNKKEAKRLCILKWEYIVKHNGDYEVDELVEEYPKLYKHKCTCPYCTLYMSSTTKTLTHCGKCPIRPKISDYNNLSESGCSQISHPYYKWFNNRTIINAKKVLELIKKS